MSQQLINIGSAPDDKTGDTLRVGATKINANFSEVYQGIEDLKVGQTAGILVDDLWADLAARKSDQIADGAGAAVIGDVGTHVDPITNAANTKNSGIFQNVAGARASGTYTFSGVGAANDTVTIAGNVITLVASAPAGAQILIGGAAADTASALQKYIAANSVALGVTATVSGAAVTVTAIATGTAGNALTIAENSAAIAVSGATLAGGKASGFTRISDLESMLAHLEVERAQALINSIQIGATILDPRDYELSEFLEAVFTKDGYILTQTRLIEGGGQVFDPLAVGGQYIDPRDYELTDAIELVFSIDNYLVKRTDFPVNASDILPPPPFRKTGPLPMVVGIGNSLVENGIAEFFAVSYAKLTKIRLKSANLGRSGATFRAIEIANGVTQALYSPTNGIVPAGTDKVTLTPNISGPLEAYGGGAGQIDALYGGRKMSWEWAAGGPMSITPYKAGKQINVTQPLPFEPILEDRNWRDGYKTNRASHIKTVDKPFECFCIFWDIANDVFDAPSPEELAAAAVAHYKRMRAMLTYQNAFLILGEINTRIEVKNSRGWQQKEAINAAVKAEFPNNWFDAKTLLNSYGTADDISKDIPPADKLYDQYQHPNDIGRAIITDGAAQFALNQGLLIDIAMSGDLVVPKLLSARSSAQPFQTIAANTDTSIATKVSLTASSVDTSFSFDAATGRYTVQDDGVFAITGKIRLKDATSAGISYYLGVGPMPAQGAEEPSVVWGTTNGTRNSLTNTRLLDAHRGDVICLYGYANTAIDLIYAELTVRRI